MEGAIADLDIPLVGDEEEFVNDSVPLTLPTDVLHRLRTQGAETKPRNSALQQLIKSQNTEAEKTVQELFAQYHKGGISLEKAKALRHDFAKNLRDQYASSYAAGHESTDLTPEQYNRQQNDF